MLINIIDVLNFMGFPTVYFKIHDDISFCIVVFYVCWLFRKMVGIQQWLIPPTTATSWEDELGFWII